MVQSFVFCFAAILKEGWWKKKDVGIHVILKTDNSALDWFLTKTTTTNIIHWSELSASLHSSKTTSHLLSLSVMLFTPLKHLLLLIQACC